MFQNTSEYFGTVRNIFHNKSRKNLECLGICRKNIKYQELLAMRWNVC